MKTLLIRIVTLHRHFLSLVWLCIPVAFCQGALAQSAALLGPSENVNGVSQSTLSMRWWQWAWSFSDGTGPISDLSGKDCAAGQPADIWFLAGTYGDEPVSRTCRMPAGRPLFFPLVNYVYFPTDKKQHSCASMRREVAKLTDDVENLQLELNGKPLRVSRAHRQAPTDCFDLGVNQRPPKRISPSAANGYYVALAPLTKGTYKLRFSGSLPDNVQKIEYTLIVE
jgi:hypothetical protein